MPDDELIAPDETAVAVDPPGSPADPYEWRLPAGRHGLPREYVVSNQRQRILKAVVATVAHGGYNGYTVQRVLRQAGVSRRTFYNLFSDRDDAFLQMYDHSADCLLARTEATWEESRDDAAVDGTERLRRCLEVLLGSVASQPVLARVCFVEVLSAGPIAIERRERYLRRFGEPLGRAIAEHSGSEPSPLMVDALAGAVYELIFSRVAQDKAAELPYLLDDLYGFSRMLFNYSPLGGVPDED